MKNIIKLVGLLAIFSLLGASVFAQTDQTQEKVRNLNLNQYRINWVDIDGDGICDNFGTENQGSGEGYGRLNNNSKGKGIRGGLGDGSGLRPQDGTGFGRGNGSRTGTCDGTGPKGNNSKGGRNR